MIPFLNLIVILIGLGLSLFGKKVGIIKGWRSGYLSMVSGIFLAFSILLIFNIGEAKIFIIFGVVGMVLEAMLDFIYDKIAGERFFAYKHLALFGYGSLLSFPFWGLAGLIFLRLGDLMR